MSDRNSNDDKTIRDRAYFIWEDEGRPEGRAHDHWKRAIGEAFRRELRVEPEQMLEEEKILAGHDDVNMPALLTRDVQGG
jgi:Protein of unknown function (DUF2934)